MKAVDPASLEGPWQLVVGDAPADLYPTITFRDGQVIQDGSPPVPYLILGTTLSFARHDVDADQSEWLTTYTFTLPATPGRPDMLSGTIATVETCDIGEGVDFVQPCALVRVAS